MSKSFLTLALALTLGACGGRVGLGPSDAGAVASGGECTTDSECVGGAAGSCEQGRCASPVGEDAGGSSNTVPPNGQPFPVCPGLKPPTGSSCPVQNQGCAYVDVTAGTCESWICSASNQWESSTPAGC